MYKLSSGPINAAWALLKAPEGGLDHAMMEQILSRLPPEEQEKAHKLSQALSQLPPEHAQRMNETAQQFIGAHDLPNIMQHLGHDMRKSVTQDIIQEGRIFKLIPLLIGVVFAIDAINRSQGAKSSFIGAAMQEAGHAITDGFIEKPNWDEVTEWEDEARLIDPFFGTELATYEDPTLGQKIGAGLFGTLSAVNPFSALRAGGTAGKAAAGATTAAGKRAAGKGISRLGARGTRRAQDKALREGMEELGDTGASFGARAAEREIAEAAGQKVGTLDRMGRNIVANNPAPGATSFLPKPQHSFLSRNLQGTKYGPAAKRFDQFQDVTQGGRWAGAKGLGMASRAVTPGVQAFGPAAAALIGGLGLGMAGNLDHNVSTAGYSPHDSGGFGMANTGQGGGGFATDYHQGNIHTGHSARSPFDTIYHEARTGSGDWSGRGVGGRSGYAVTTGENMKIGDRMLKELTEMMYKAKCPKCGKVNCNCKEYKNKEDDKKKPAHGMVIVIGTKAGPGPSTDGKRDKLDSEKDKKDE